jgi:lipid II:glycine glycyltransferase (peptidoglycan interpeptide bridge formation enzyme)
MRDIYSVKAMYLLNKKDWGKFVYDHPHGNIFQTPEMAEVYTRTKNYEPISLAVIDDTDEIVAILLAVVRKVMGGILEPFSSMAIIQGGPLFAEGESGIDALKVLMDHYDKLARKKALFTEIRNMWDTSAISNLLNEIGYEYEEHLNFLVDLTKSKEDVWYGLSKSRRRYIRKAREKGVTVKEIKNRNLISSFYDLLQQTYKNAKIPLTDISLFESAFDTLTPTNMLKVFLASYNNEYIGGIMCPIYKGVITEWYVTGSRAHSKLYPSDMVSWYPIEWGLENGYHTFDFLGAGKPDEEYGVRDFKRQFGGNLVNFGRYKRVHSPLKMTIAEKGFQVYKRVFIR